MLPNRCICFPVRLYSARIRPKVWALLSPRQLGAIEKMKAQTNSRENQEEEHINHRTKANAEGLNEERTRSARS
jgi:hypothetical protein